MNLSFLHGRFGPTIARRLFFAIVLAYPAIWLVLLSRELVLEQGYLRQQIPEALAADSRALAAFDDPAQALAFMQSAVRRYRGIADGQPWMLQLWRTDTHQMLFQDGALAGSPPQSELVGQPQQTTLLQRKGIEYHLLRADSGAWSLRFALPKLTLPGIIARDAGDLMLNLSILIALPIIMLPIWFAIGRGLLPLRVLSQQLAGRAAQDLAPLGIDAKYGELKPVVAALESLLSRLRGKVAREQAFVQDAAHELRTPLALISAQVQVLTHAGSVSAKLSAEQEIDHAIARAAHLVGQLLELARVDGLAVQERQSIDLAQLVQQELARRVPQAMARGIELELVAPDSLMWVLERNTFLSILLNLLDNAIRYGREGGNVLVELNIAASSPADCLVDCLILSVSDDGPGIGQDEREQVFERFYRGRGHDAAGAGLGLAIVRQAAVRLGATVALSSGLEGKGCCFVVSIAQSAPLESTTAF